MAEKNVRYRVLSKTFVNDQLVDPKGRKDVFVMGVPGLEGPALQRADAPAVEAAAATPTELAQGVPGSVVPPYIPEGLPEVLVGATDRETIDKLWAHLAESRKPAPPYHPEGLPMAHCLPTDRETIDSMLAELQQLSAQFEAPAASDPPSTDPPPQTTGGKKPGK